MPYVYRPADNKTPVNHPVFGHLEYGTVCDDPLCADDPNFELVPDGEDLGSLKRSDLNDLAEQAGVTDPHTLPNKQAVIDAIAQQTASTPEPEPDQAAAPTDTPAAQESADAGDTGRSN